MNISTFKDAVRSKRSALSNELADDDDDDGDVKVFRGNIEGEEDGPEDQFNDAGEAYEPFNLRTESEIGHFDENMNFVFKKERVEVDQWLANLDESEMEKAIGETAAAAKRRQALVQAKDDELDTRIKLSIPDLKRALLALMQPGETVARAMRRLSGHSKSYSDAGSLKRRRPGNVADENGLSVKVDKESLHRLTDVANDLLSNGYSGVYEMTYESIESSSVMWEYQGLDGVVHGPFTSQSISTWKAQGYFTGSSAVLMRKVGSPADMDNFSYYSQSHLAVEASNKTSGSIDSSSAKKAKPSNDDLMGDLDSDDDVEDVPLPSDAASASKPVLVSNDLPKLTPYADLSRGPFMSSDDIDFGDHTNLMANVNAASSHTYADDVSDDEGDDVGNKTRKRKGFEETNSDED